MAQMRAPRGDAKKRHLLKSALPTMPASTRPPFGKWDATRVGEEQLHRLVAAVYAGGVEFFDLAGTNASKSVGAELRARCVRVGVHTSPQQCNKKNCMYIAVRVVLWHLEHPTSEWGRPPPPPPQDGAMLNACAEWVKVLGHMKKRRTGWASTVLKEFAKVAEELPPVWGGGKGPMLFAPLIENMVPMVVLHQPATRDPPPRTSLS